MDLEGELKASKKMNAVLTARVAQLEADLRVMIEALSSVGVITPVEGSGGA